MQVDAQRREQLIGTLAQRTADLGLTAPAILVLETVKPLAYLGAQMLWAAQPFLNVWWQDKDLRDLALVLEDPTGVEAIIKRLESSSSP
jgi:hypothetical protein